MGSLNAKAALWVILCRWLQPLGKSGMKTIYLTGSVALAGSLILTFTNPVAYDNGGPVPSLAPFIAAWNRLQLAPSLRLATATQAVWDAMRDAAAPDAA